MTDSSKLNQDRRRLLKLLGGSAALFGVSGLTACSDSGSQPAPPAKPATPPEPAAPAAAAPAAAPAPAPAAPEPMAAEAAAASGMRLDEESAQARALGYRHDSGTVDASKHPGHAAGQACANCMLFVGQPGDEWGNCGIFPGRQVNAGGWCSAYSKKA